jgi:lysophospholipase L1-like esterase
MKIVLLVALFLGLVALPQRKKKVWLIGDSTMSVKEARAYPEAGWGMAFTQFFDSTIEVDNRAKNGRSTKSFREEGLWAPVLNELQEGDYVFIQFGHNDEGKEKLGRYTTPDEFRANLRRYVSEAKGKKALPVLLTPVSRRSFDSTGQVRETHPVYTDVVKDVARAEGVVLIDLNEKSKALLQRFGPEGSKLLFNHLQPGEHPNYPEGKKDDTHFNELGARLVAELVWQELLGSALELKNHVAPKAK